MPWMGPGRRYFYQRQRIGGRIVYTYYGAGETATLIAQLDKLDRERRSQEAREWQIARSEFAEHAATPAAFTLLLSEARAAVAAALTAAGYHQHKRGEWRKRRAKKET